MRLHDVLWKIPYHPDHPASIILAGEKLARCFAHSFISSPGKSFPTRHVFQAEASQMSIDAVDVADRHMLDAMIKHDGDSLAWFCFRST